MDDNGVGRTGFGIDGLALNYMKTVYVVSSGSVYEGGRVDGAFLRKDLADAKFNELVEDSREMGQSMEEYELDQKHPRESGFWTEEKLNERDGYKEIIFHGSDFISMTEWNCEE